MEEAAAPIIPLRVVPPPSVLLTKEQQMPVNLGATKKGALLEPLTPREMAMTCAIADALQALRYRAETTENNPGYALDESEKATLLGLLVAFKDATGCAWVDADWT